MNEIHSFLIDFGIAANSEDTIKLREYIIPMSFYDGHDYQDDAIQRIINDQDTRGMDFEYSPKAFSLITDSLYKDFIPINKEVRALFDHPEEAKAVLDSYRDDEIAVLKYGKKTIVVLILGEERMQLFFTEGINNLTPE